MSSTQELCFLFDINNRLLPGPFVQVFVSLPMALIWLAVSMLFTSLVVSGVFVFGLWLLERLKSISLLFYELETNLLCFTFSLLFVYQSFCRNNWWWLVVDIHSEDKVSLDMEDPKKSFVTRLVKSLLSIVPGLGFFRRKLFSVAKLDWIVCSTKMECE